jgi:hypothetical protein
MAAGSIIVDLLMRTGSFETDTKRAEKRLRELKREAEQIGKAIGGAFVLVGGASVLLVKSAIDAADATSKLAQSTGTTVEELSALSYAAGLADVSQEELGAGLVKLTKNMSAAAGGSKEAASGFEALGISVKNVDGTLKSSDKVLSEIADKFASFADGPEKTALALSLFGKAGAQLIPLLNAGSAGLAEMKVEAERLGVVLSTETAQAAEEFNDNLTRISTAIGGVANRAAAELLPTLIDVSQAFVDLAKNEAFIEVTSEVVKGAIGGLITVFQTLAIVGSDVGFVFLSVGREIGAWAAQLAAVASGDLKGFRAISDAVREDGERARAELDKFQARIAAIGQPTAAPAAAAFRPSQNYGAGGSRPAAPSLAGAGGGANKVSEAERYLENLQRQVDRTRQLTAAEQLLSDVQSGRLKISGKVTRAQLDAAALAVDAATYEAGQRRNLEDAIVAEREARVAVAEAAFAEAQRLVEGNEALAEEIALIGADTKARRALEKARISSAIAVAKDRLATVEATDGMGMETQAIRDQIAALERRQELLAARNGAEDFHAEQERIKADAHSLRDTLQGTLGQGLEDALDGNFKSMGDLFARMLKRMAAEAAAAKIMEAILGTDSRGSSGGSFADLVGLFSTIIGGFSGGSGITTGDSPYSATGEAIRGRRAGGGDVHPGGDYWVGENGPERFRPSTSGRIIPNGAGGGGMKVIVNAPPGTQVARQNQIDDGTLELWLEMAEERVASGIASGTGKGARALKSRGLRLDGTLPRRA